jgi:hypothetical protein
MKKPWSVSFVKAWLSAFVDPLVGWQVLQSVQSPRDSVRDLFTKTVKDERGRRTECGQRLAVGDV